MNNNILTLIETFSEENISLERKEILDPLTAYIQNNTDKDETIRLNFICTHNSRRSHLSQIWAQTMASYFNVKNIFCYSGGTEATALFPKVAETLLKQGFEIIKLDETKNPIYAIKYAQNEMPIICFSKKYDSDFNPKINYAAILTCNNADVGCPIVIGAEARFPIKYNDPKEFDNTDLMDEKYAERSLEIAQEFYYIFKNIKK
jgi:arsenate reductase